MNMLDGIRYFYEKHGHDQLRCHSVRSSPSVGILTSGRVGGGAVRDDDFG